MNTQQKRKLAPIFAAILLLVLPHILTVPVLAKMIMLLLAYAIAGYATIWTAIRNILRGQVFDENFLMAIASIGAIALGEYAEAAAVMLFYKIGEWFESGALEKSRKSIGTLMDIRPDYANLLTGKDERRVNPDEVNPGDLILIKPGEKVPLDGIVRQGFSTLDTSALTGESMPREIKEGDSIISGSINMTGLLTVETTKAFEESTVSKILELVEFAGSKKAKIETFITKFARVYTPAVVGASALLAIVPPLLLPDATFGDWVYRALIFLVVSCPCALVISIPLSFFGGIGGASRQGVLVKGSNYLEALSRAEIVVFDKTGTLTKGTFEVEEIFVAPCAPEDMTGQQLLQLAAYAESHSSHPISKSIRKTYEEILEGDPFMKVPDDGQIKEVEELPGYGVKAMIGHVLVHVGNLKLMEKASLPEADLVQANKTNARQGGTMVHVAINGRYAGYISVSDRLKPDAKKALSDLKALGIPRITLLTGDKDEVGKKVADELGFSDVYTELLPAHKVQQVEQMLGKKSSKGILVFVGDGINDAPVLARADVGVAMGGLGSDAAIEAADVVLMTDEPSKVATVIRIAKKTTTIAKQNIVLALGIKGVVLLLGALGMATMWAAIFADVGVAFLAIMNAMRALQGKN